MDGNAIIDRQLGYSPIKRFLVIGTIFGILFIMVTPFNGSSDELGHFAKAYNTSTLQFVPEEIGAEDEALRPIFPPRSHGGLIPSDIATLYNAMADNYYRPDLYPWKVFYELNGDENDKILAPWGGMTTYAPVAFIPQTIGISIGRLLHVSPAVLYLLARIFNLAAYLLLCALALKRMPAPKWAAFMIALNPMSLSLAASCSGDAMMIACTFLFTAFFADIIRAEVIDKRKIIPLVVLIILLTMMKPILLLFGLMIFLIPNDKLAFSRKIIWCLPTAIVCVALYVGWQSLMPVMNDVYGPHAIPSDQIWMLIHRPEVFISGFFNGFLFGANGNVYMSNDLVLSTVGMLGNYDTPIGAHWFLLYVIVLFICVLYQNGRDDYKDFSLNTKRKIILVVIFALFVLANFISIYIIWNVVGAPVIEGLQGRYFIPIAIIGVLLFCGKKQILEMREKTVSLFATITVILVLAAAEIAIIQRYGLIDVNLFGLI